LKINFRTQMNTDLTDPLGFELIDKFEFLPPDPRGRGFWNLE